jgi:hypothetical protein
VPQAQQALLDQLHRLVLILQHMVVEVVAQAPLDLQVAVEQVVPVPEQVPQPLPQLPAVVHLRPVPQPQGIQILEVLAVLLLEQRLLLDYNRF